MRIKRFEAPDNKTALMMVKKEMGDDALILATRTLAPSERGNGSRARVEVVAAIDYGPEEISAAGPLKDGGPGIGMVSTYDYSVVRNGGNIKPQIPSEILSTAPGNNQNEFPRRGLSGLQRSKSVQERPSSIKMPDRQPVAANHRETGKTRPARETVAKWRDQLIEELTIKPPLVNSNRHSPVILALVGPTGVGKTTTAAKLAAWYTLREGLKVTLLSMDCYRIGATDQLRTYARIMKLPCEVALRQKDFYRSIARHQKQDIIIVDTAGKSPYDTKHIKELTDWFATEETVQPQLVLSATTKKEDMTHIIETYRPLLPVGIMVTKLDETRAYATLCQQLAASSLPISCLSTGQKVPEDFMIASKYFLSTLFREGWNAATAEVGAA